MHDLGYLHRDIKPKNLLWFKLQNKVKIADFGIAKKIHSVFDVSDYLVGSFPYIAPEAFEGNYSSKSDIYALGCTLYELFTSDFPFDVSIKPGESIEKQSKIWLAAHKSPDRPNAISRNPRLLSFELAAVIQRMISISPDQRPSLDFIIQAFEAEKNLSKVTLPELPVKGSNVKILREKPRFISDYLISPDFHRDAMQHSLFFIFIRLPYLHENKLGWMFAILDSFFDSSYSCFEVYGRYDFVVKVWSDAGGDIIQTFTDRMTELLLDNKKRDIRVFRAAHSHYLPTPKTKNISSDPDKTEVLIKLHALQNGNTNRSDIVSWLTNRAIIIRSLKQFDPNRQIKVFMLIKSLDSTNASEQENHYSLIRQVISDARINYSTARLSHYSRSYENLSGGQDSNTHFIISYVAPNYAGVSSMTETIVNGLKDIRIQSNSLLATGRYFIFSEEIKFGGLSGKNSWRPETHSK